MSAVDTVASDAVMAGIAPRARIDSRFESAKQSREANYGGVYSYDALQNLNASLTPCIEDIVNEGQIVILAGSFGVGKTLFSLQMSLALAIGRDFVGRKVFRPRIVGYLDMEDGAALTRERVDKQPVALSLTPEETELLRSNWIYVDGDAEGPLQWLRLHKIGFHTLTEFVKARGIEVLILDNFGRVFPGKEAEEHPVKEFFADLKRLTSNCPSLQRGLILLPHHVTKPSQDSNKVKPSLLRAPYDWLSRVRGSGRILDFSQARMGLDMEELAGDKYYILNGISKSMPIQPLVLERDADSLIFELNTDTDLVVREVFMERPRQNELFGLLPTDRSIRHSDIKALIGRSGKPFPKGTISEMLKTATSNNLLERLGDGSYRRMGRNAQTH